jgi:serine/threonine-protein kinase RsbW
MPNDLITLTVPAKDEYARIVRMTAAAIVSRLGMSYDDVEDVRMAAEEAFVYATDTVAPGDDLSFVFELDDDGVVIRVPLGTKPVLSDDEVDRRASYATFILESVCDSFELASDEDGNASLRLVKRIGVGDDA